MKITKQNCRNLEVGTVISGLTAEAAVEIVSQYHTLQESYDVECMEVGNIDECGTGELIGTGHIFQMKATELISLDAQTY